MLVKHPLLKTGRKSYSILFYLLITVAFCHCCFLLLVGFVLFSTMLGLRFFREANMRETSWIIYRRLKKEKVVRERERQRESNIAEGAFLKFQTNLNKKNQITGLDLSSFFWGANLVIVCKESFLDVESGVSRINQTPLSNIINYLWWLLLA